MSKEKIPLFDIGDTLTPAKKFSRDFFRAEMMRQGVKEPPRYPFSGYNEFDVDSIRKWVFEEEVDADPEKMVKRYMNAKKLEMEDRGMFKTLKKVSENFSPIGILSDNRVAAKKFFEEMFKQKDVDYDTFVVSDEVGVRKPKKQIFQEFIDRRGVEGERCVYFGNRGDIDSACRKVGMDFVWVTEHDTFGSEWAGVQVDNLDYENVEKAISEVEKI